MNAKRETNIPLWKNIMRLLSAAWKREVHAGGILGILRYAKFAI